MPSSGPLHPLAADGSAIEATFELSTAPVFDLVYHHKAGGRNSNRSVNVDYHKGLEILLGRLAQLEMTIVRIAVDSSVALKLDPADRELDLEFPIKLGPATDSHELRLTITRAQKPIARRPDVKPGGGNDQKSIRITLASEDDMLTFDHLRTVLVAGEVVLD